MRIKFKGTKRAAQIECARLITAIEKGDYAEPNKTTLAEFLERWLMRIRPNVAPRTHERYAELCRRNVVPLLGEVVLSKLATPTHISGAYTTAQTQGTTSKGPFSAQTVVHMHRILKQALGPIRWERIHRNSEDNVTKPPKVEKRQMQVYDVPQTVTLIEAVRGHRVFVPVVLAAMCGLRRGEIAALRWRNVDLDGARLSVVESAEQTRGKKAVRYKDPKNGRTRSVAISSTVVAELRAWRAAQAQELLARHTNHAGNARVHHRSRGRHPAEQLVP